MRMSMDEKRMEKLVKVLLSIDDGEKFVYYNITGKLSINFKGNKHNVRKRLLKWLNVSERLHQMEVKSDD